MKKQLLREVTPLTSSDCFTIFSRVKTEFNFPLHYHEEFELNLILNAAGTRRIIGDHIAEIDQVELVLVGSNLPHVWQTHNCKSKEIREVTIQFHKDLFDDKLLKRNQLSYMRMMFEQSSRGVLFSQETATQMTTRIVNLNKRHGFDSVLELISILHDLSVSRNFQVLSDAAFTNSELHYNSRRIEKVANYMNQNFRSNGHFSG